MRLLANNHFASVAQAVLRRIVKENAPETKIVDAEKTYIAALNVSLTFQTESGLYALEDLIK